ncbi:uncharacterized protein [Macrobrachium rosenbergii]|uniref:uncharacterized protein n=1 Tax=Macrobrachium rosenbergii TaxID=79674 RepID=UPI0034D60C9C
MWSTLARPLGTSYHTTTAYNPAAKGLVERSHRALKASLMVCCTTEDWKYQLPWVVLGLRTAPRANGDPSAVEKIYGEPLVVPGKLVMEDRHNLSVQRLRDIVCKFATCKWTYTDRSVTFTPPGLSSTTHVFVRDDAVCPPLTRPYRGPFHLLERNNKAFCLTLHGKDDWVSIDCLRARPPGGNSRCHRAAPSARAVTSAAGPLQKETAGLPLETSAHTRSQPLPRTPQPPAHFAEPRHSSTPQQIHGLIRRYPRLVGGQYL